jgi:ribosomal protein L32
MYGCPVAEDPTVSRLFPFILSKVSPFFSYRGCSFKLQDDKEQTQRITMFKETAIPAIYTLEATFSGMSIGPFAGQHLTASQLQLIGKHVCLALLIYGNHVPPQAALPQPSPDDSGSQPESAYMKFSDISREDCERELGKCIETGDASDEEGGSSGSDSSPSEDNLDPEELSKLLPAVPISKAERTQRKVMPRQASAAQARRAKEETKAPAKCQSCLEPLLPNHICAKLRVLKPLSNPYSRLYTKRVGLNTYVSPVTGKTMHDQATQTPKPGTVLESRSRSLPTSGTSAREGIAASQKFKEIPVDARGRPEPKVREEQKPGSPEKRLPVIQKPGVRESSAPLKQRRV